MIWCHLLAVVVRVIVQARDVILLQIKTIIKFHYFHHHKKDSNCWQLVVDVNKPVSSKQDKEWKKVSFLFSNYFNYNLLILLRQVSASDTVFFI